MIVTLTRHVPGNFLFSAPALPMSRVSRTASVIPGICVSSFVFISSSPLLIYEDCLSCNRLPYPYRVSGTISPQGHHLLSAGPVTTHYAPTHRDKPLVTAPDTCSHAVPKG